MSDYLNKKSKIMNNIILFGIDAYFDGYTGERGCRNSAPSVNLAEKSDKESPKHRCLGLI